MATLGAVGSQPANLPLGAPDGAGDVFAAGLGSGESPAAAPVLLASAAPTPATMTKSAAEIEAAVQSWINGVDARRVGQPDGVTSAIDNVFGGLASIRNDLRKLQRGEFGFTNDTQRLLRELNNRALWLVEGAKAVISAANIYRARASTTNPEIRTILNDAAAELATYSGRISLGNTQSQLSLDKAKQVIANVNTLLANSTAGTAPQSPPAAPPAPKAPPAAPPAPKAPPAGSGAETPPGYRSLDGETDVQTAFTGTELEIRRPAAEGGSGGGVDYRTLLVKVAPEAASPNFPFARVDAGIGEVLSDFVKLRGMLPKGANAELDSLLGSVSRDWDSLLTARNNMANAVNRNDRAAQQEALNDFQNAAEGATRRVGEAAQLLDNQAFAQQALEQLRSMPGSPNTDPRFQTRLEQGDPNFKINTDPFANIWVGILDGATKFDQSILNWYASTGLPGAEGARNLSQRLEDSLRYHVHSNQIDISDPLFGRSSGLAQGTGNLSLGTLLSLTGGVAGGAKLGVLGTVGGGAAGSTLSQVATGAVPSNPNDIGVAFAGNFVLGGISFGLADELTNGLSAEALQRNMGRVANGLPGTEATVGPIKMTRVEGGVRVTNRATGGTAFYDFARQAKPTAPVDDVIDVAARPVIGSAGTTPPSQPASITPPAIPPVVGSPPATAALISQLRGNGVPAIGVRTITLPGGGQSALVTTESGGTLAIRLNPDGTLNAQSLANNAGVRFINTDPPGESAPGGQPDPRRFDLSETYYGRGRNLNDTGAFESYRQFYPNLSDQQWKELKATLISGGLTPDSLVYRGQPANSVTFSPSGTIQTVGKLDPIGRAVDIYAAAAPSGSAASPTMPLFSEANRYQNRPADMIAPDGGIYTATTQNISDNYGGDNNVVTAMSVDQLLRQGLLPHPDITYAASGAQSQGVAVFWSAQVPGGKVEVPSSVVGGRGAGALRERSMQMSLDYVRRTFLNPETAPDLSFRLVPNPDLWFRDPPGTNLTDRFAGSPDLDFSPSDIRFDFLPGDEGLPPVAASPTVGSTAPTPGGESVSFVNPLDGRTLVFDPATRRLTPIDGVPLTPEESLSYSKPLPPDLPVTTAKSLLDLVREKVDLRIGATAQITNPTADGAAYRGSVFGGLETVRQLWLSREGIVDAASRGDMRQLGDIFSNAFGIGQRLGEDFVDPQLVRRWGMFGFGSGTALQFKADTLADQAQRSFLGQDTAFIFEPVPSKNRIEADLPALNPGNASITPYGRTGILTGSVRLNVTPTTLQGGQTDIFGNSSGEFYVLNRDLKVDKALKEIYIGKLQTPVADTPGIEYRAESSGQIIIPAGSVLPSQFVDIVNRRVGAPSFSVSFRLPEGSRVEVSDLHRLNRAPTLDRPTVVRPGAVLSPGMIDAATVKAELVERGGAVRDSSVPGKPFDSASRNLDVTFYPGESLLNRAVELITGGRINNMPPRSVPGARDMFEFFVPADTNATSNKVRWKVNLLPVFKIPGFAKLEINGYLVLEAQKGKPTNLVAGDKETTLTFDDGSGPVSVAVPGWFSTMLGREAGVFRQRSEARDVNIVPIGGVESLRTYLNPYLRSGTAEQQAAIRDLYNTLFYGSEPLLVDGKAMPQSIRDNLLNVFRQLATPDSIDVESVRLDEQSNAAGGRAVVSDSVPPITIGGALPSGLGGSGLIAWAGGGVTDLQPIAPEPYETTAPGGALPPSRADDIVAQGQAAYARLSPDEQKRLRDIVATAFTAPTTAPGGHLSVEQIKARFPDLFAQGSALSEPSLLYSQVLAQTGDRGLAYSAFNTGLRFADPAAPAGPRTLTVTDKYLDGRLGNVTVEGRPPTAEERAIARQAFDSARLNGKSESEAGAAAEAAVREPDRALQGILQDLGVALPDYSPANTEFMAQVTRGFSDKGIDFAQLTSAEQEALKGDYNRLFAETKDQRKALQGAAESVMTTRMQEIQARDHQRVQTDLTKALDFAGDKVYQALAPFDPELAGLVDRGVKGAAFVSALIDLVNNKPQADRNAIMSGLGLLAGGALGQDTAKVANAVIGVVNFGDALKSFKPGGDAVSGSLGAASAAASIFSSGLFGQELQKMGRDVGKGVSAATLAYNFVKNPTSLNGLAIGSFIVGELWKTPMGQTVVAGINVGASFLSSAMLGPVLGPMGVGLALVGFVGSLARAISGKTLKITSSVDASGDGVNDKITYKTKKDDWFYEITNGTQTLPFSAVGYRLVAETAPANSGRLVVGQNGRFGGGSHVEFVNPDGSTRRMAVSVDTNHESGEVKVYTGRGLSAGSSAVRRLKTTTDSAGVIWVTDPTRPASAEQRITGYRLDIDARFEGINDAPSLEGAGASVSTSISAEQYNELLAQFGSPAGIVQGADARSGAFRQFLSGNVSFKQEKKNEGFTSYTDFNGDGVKDRVTTYQKIKGETDGDDSMRYQLLGRDGRVIQEWATDKNGAPAPTSRAARAIMGGDYFTDFSGKQVWGRFNIENYMQLMTGQDATRDGDLSAGGLGAYLGNEGSLGPTLEANQSMGVNQRLVSTDGRHVLLLQGDGNLVVYERFPDTGEIRRVAWNSGTAGRGADRFVVQGDGNLVLYAGTAAVWSSGTAGKGPGRLHMQTDGNLAMYSQADERVLWSSSSVARNDRDMQKLMGKGYGQVIAAAPPPAAAPAAAPPSAPPPAAPPPAANQPVPAGMEILGSVTENVVLRANQGLLSANGRYLTVFQADGNLVVYDMQGTMKALWSTNTQAKAAGGFAAMQADGNLVVYDAQSRPQWASRTEGSGVARGFSLAMQDDGNLVVYDSRGSQPLWSLATGRLAKAAAVPAAPAPASAPAPAPALSPPAAANQSVPAGVQIVGAVGRNVTLSANQSLVSGNGRYILVFQGDGNLVVYDMLGGMDAVWSTNTQGKAAGGFAAMQADGNLVVYDAQNRPQWASSTNGAGVGRDFSLAMQDDGNLVIYDGRNSQPLWSLGTGRLGRAAA